MPPSYPIEIGLRTLAAVLECKCRDLDRGEVVRRANQLAALTRQ